MDNATAIEERKVWLNEALGSIETENLSNFVDDNLDLIKTIVADNQKIKRIFLWLGEGSNDKLATARVLYHLSGIPIPIFKPNFSKAEIKNIKGEKIDAISMHLLNSKDIPELARHFKELSQQDRKYFESLWNSLVTDKAVIHIFDKNGEYWAGDEQFLDQFILNRCTNEFQRSSLIIGYTLCDIWFENPYSDVGDIFLFHRLNKLGEEGKLEISTVRKILMKTLIGVVDYFRCVRLFKRIPAG